MGQNLPRAKASSKPLHKVEGGRIGKSRKSQDSASARKIKADAQANSISTCSSKSAPEPKPKHSQTQAQGQATQQPAHGASETHSSSTRSSIKQSRPPKNVISPSVNGTHRSYHQTPPVSRSTRVDKPSISESTRSDFPMLSCSSCHHLDLIVAADPDFCHMLEEFSCGDADTGFGSQLSDAAVIRLAAACPNLQQVLLTSAVALTDAALLAFLTYCPNIHTLSITGNGKQQGQIGPSALMELKKKKKTLAKHLRKLDLIDQPQTGRTLQSTSRARQLLIITAGSSSYNCNGFANISTWMGGMVKLEGVQGWF